MNKILIATIFGFLFCTLSYAEPEPELEKVAAAAWYMAEDTERLSQELHAINLRNSRASETLHMDSADVYHAAIGTFGNVDQVKIVRDEFRSVVNSFKNLELLMRDFSGINDPQNRVVKAIWARVQSDYAPLYYAVYPPN